MERREAELARAGETRQKGSNEQRERKIEQQGGLQLNNILAGGE